MTEMERSRLDRGTGTAENLNHFTRKLVNWTLSDSKRPVDLQLRACGIDFAEAQRDGDIEIFELEDVRIPVAGKRLLLRMKETLRPADAIRYSEAVLGVDTDLSPQLYADLSWARGLGYAKRYVELQREDDWREANRSLEAGTVDGTHRIESAAFLALIQVMAPHDNGARARRYADIVLTEAPASTEAETMRRLLARLDGDQ